MRSDELVDALLGQLKVGGPEPPEQEETEADLVSSLIANLLDETGAPTEPAAGEESSDLGNLLATLLGEVDMPTEPASGEMIETRAGSLPVSLPPDRAELAEMLNAVARGGKPSAELDKQLEPVVLKLVKRLGLPPATARKVVAFILSKMLAQQHGTTTAESARPAKRKRREAKKPKPSSTAKPKPSSTAKPKPSSTAKPKPSSTAKPKPSSTAKPKPSSTAKDKDAKKPKPSSTAKDKDAKKPKPSSTAKDKDAKKPKPSSTAKGKDVKKPKPGSQRRSGTRLGEIEGLDLGAQDEPTGGAGAEV